MTNDDTDSPDHSQTIVLVISHARKPNGERKAGIYLGMLATN